MATKPSDSAVQAAIDAVVAKITEEYKAKSANLSGDQ